MSNKNIAWGLIISWAVALINALGSETDGLYSLAGIGILVFSIIAIIRLFSLSNNRE